MRQISDSARHAAHPDRAEAQSDQADQLGRRAQLRYFLIRFCHSRTLVALRTGQPLQAQQLVEEVEEADPKLARGDLARQMLDRWVVGTPESAAAQLRDLATTFGVDEVMVHPVAGALRGTPTDLSPAREETPRLLGAALA